MHPPASEPRPKMPPGRGEVSTSANPVIKPLTSEHNKNPNSGAEPSSKTGFHSILMLNLGIIHPGNRSGFDSLSDAT
jgi:hypothetical protein